MNNLVRDITCGRDLNLDYIKLITEEGKKIYHELLVGNPGIFRNYLAEQDCDLAFSQASTRTYISFLKAMEKLGANVSGYRDAKESAVSKGESIYHTIETLIGQGIGPRFIVVRDSLEGAAEWAKISALRAYAKKVREFAKHYHKFPENLILPVIFNGGGGQQTHPSQLLVDCGAILHRFGEIEGIDFGECNDLGGSRVVSSHIEGAALLDWKLHFCPLPISGAQLSLRQRYNILRDGIQLEEYNSVKELLKKAALLYVSRYQYNLRGEETGDHAAEIFSQNHPRINRELAVRYGKPIFHAGPVDKNAGEIHPDLYEHPLDFHGIQADFGEPIRMAMCIYAINNRLFELDGIIKTLDPERYGYHKVDLSDTPQKEIIEPSFTPSQFVGGNGYNIDHITPGCGVAIHQYILSNFPGHPIVLSSNIVGKGSNSTPKDQIKWHTPENYPWPVELDRIVALFTEHTSEKSCRVSRFANQKRVQKWAYRTLIPNGETCVNVNCVTQPKHKESIAFKHRIEMVQDLEVEICPFCGTPQPGENLVKLGLIKS